MHALTLLYQETPSLTKGSSVGSICNWLEASEAVSSYCGPSGIPQKVFLSFHHHVLFSISVATYLCVVAL